VGSLIGAVGGAWRRERPSARLVVVSAVLLSAGQVVLAGLPSFWLVAALLVPIGVVIILFNQATMQRVALGVEPALRGRVLAVFTLVTLGTAPAAALFIGWSASAWGARWAIGVGAVVTLVGALLAAAVLARAADPRGGSESADAVRGGSG
jgi:hypothetical protein